MTNMGYGFNFTEFDFGYKIISRALSILSLFLKQQGTFFLHGFSLSKICSFLFLSRFATISINNFYNNFHQYEITVKYELHVWAIGLSPHRVVIYGKIYHSSWKPKIIQNFQQIQRVSLSNDIGISSRIESSMCLYLLSKENKVLLDTLLLLFFVPAKYHCSPRPSFLQTIPCPGHKYI